VDDGTSFANGPLMTMPLGASSLSLPPLAPVRLLAAHHDDVAHMCERLLAATLADCPRDLVDSWRTFERTALEHMHIEEQLIVPGYAVLAPADARLITAEHHHLRRLLNTLGLEVELHQIRETTVRSLLAGLHAHAAGEERGMYPWAAAHLPGPVQGAVATRLLRMQDRETPSAAVPATR
jgi:hypothetical protein